MIESAFLKITDSNQARAVVLIAIQGRYRRWGLPVGAKNRTARKKSKSY
jgi:hypothetical protein